MYLCVIFCIAFLLVIFKLYIKLTTGWCRSQVCLRGKTVIVTGANTGIGYETALDLAKRGARLILACRNESRAQAARDKIIKETHNNNVVYRLVDFTSLKSVRKFAEEIKATEERLDILINNAGIFSRTNDKTEDGLILIMQVNYFAQVLLTELLLDMLNKTSGRIVNVASTAPIFAAKDDDLEDLNRYNGRQVYQRSKLCLVLYTIELSSRLNGTGVTTYSLHPGVVKTEVFRDLPMPYKTLIVFIVETFFKDATEGAQTTIFCAVENGIEKYSGEHFHDCHLVSRYSTVRDPQLARRVWINTKKVLNFA